MNFVVAIFPSDLSVLVAAIISNSDNTFSFLALCLPLNSKQEVIGSNPIIGKTGWNLRFLLAWQQYRLVARDQPNDQSIGKSFVVLRICKQRIPIAPQPYTSHNHYDKSRRKHLNKEYNTASNKILTLSIGAAEKKRNRVGVKLIIGMGERFYFAVFSFTNCLSL